MDGRRCGPRRRRRGAVLVLIGLMLPALIFLAALVVDGGMLMSRRRQTQAVADAAAHAAACLLSKYYLVDTGLDPLGRARAAALAIANDNGYANDASGGSPAGGSTSLTINIPPTSGTFANKAGNAEVIVTFNQPRYFSSAFGSAAVIPVTARSVGRVVTNQPTSILLTDPSAPGALSLSGGAKLTTNGGIQVNSGDPGAVSANNGAYADDVGGVSIVGGYTTPGPKSAGSYFSVTPTTGQPSVADPKASLAAPSTSGLTVQGAPPSHGIGTINPGIYNGGLTLGGGANITMNPGIYYMKGGGFNVANGVKLSGVGVTIYVDPAGTGIDLGGGTTVDLSAPTSGPYKDIVYYQDRSNTSGLDRIANGAKVTMVGTIYAPNSALAFAGGTSTSSYGTQFIVKSLSLSNGVNINIITPTSGGGTAAPFLAE